MSIFGSSTYVPEGGISLYPKQKAWSFSAVQAHSKCPLAFRFRRIDRLPEPPSPHLERGKEAHADVAHYIESGEWRVGSSVRSEWTPYLDMLRPSSPSCELQQGFTAGWETCEWYAPNVWLRVVLDCVHTEQDSRGRTGVVVHEWKTGRSYPDHAEQLKLYGLAGLLLWPQAHDVRVVLCYLDPGPSKRTVGLFKRESLDELKSNFIEFSEGLLNDDIYPARPNRYCGSCHYRQSNNGPCKYG